MQYDIKRAGFNPANKIPGKYACQEGMNSHNNYGTANFTAAKQAARHANKQTLKAALYDYDPNDLDA